MSSLLDELRRVKKETRSTDGVQRSQDRELDDNLDFFSLSNDVPTLCRTAGIQLGIAGVLSRGRPPFCSLAGGPRTRSNATSYPYPREIGFSILRSSCFRHVDASQLSI